MGFFDWLRKGSTATTNSSTRGITLLRENKWAEARSAFRIAEPQIDAHDHTHKLHTLIAFGIALLGDSQFDDALAAFERARPLCTSDAGLTYILKGAISAMREMKAGEKAPLIIPTLPLDDAPTLDRYVPLQAKVLHDVFLSRSERTETAAGTSTDRTAVVGRVVHTFKCVKG